MAGIPGSRESSPRTNRQLSRALVPIVVAIVIALIPAPSGLEPSAWRYFALFVGVILGLILEPVPAALIGMIGVTLGALLGLVTPKPADAVRWALSGFTDTTVWLIFTAYMLALGYQKSGLGRRVALFLVRRLGARTLGLGYAVALSDLVVAPFTPSNTARSGGIIYPVIQNIPPLYGSEPGPTAGKVGAFLMWTAFASTCVTSSMFITSLAPNALTLSLILKGANIQVSWTEWFVGFLPVGVVLFVLTPLLVYWLYPPQVRVSTEVPEWAGQELGKMGAVSRREWTMAGLALLALVLWIFAAARINTTTVALVVLILMVLLGVISWDDVLANKQAWNVLVWFATLVTMAGGLSQVNFLEWLAKGVASSLAGIAVGAMVVLFVASYFVVHYMFASLTAHVTALLPALLAVAVAVPGMPARMLALLLAYSLGLMGILTPYATGPAPIYYGSGYIARRDFWRLGLIFGLIYLVALLVIGIPYLGAIGR
ncbi:MAG: DASS family sodium-coupled anion symporter [Armatimonadota bacterium]|nr:DASS family sodium-coupled anion symporter [Armatimonadota bacterium]